MDIIENEMINAAHELNLWAQITEFRYENYTVILSIRTAADSDPSQSLPAAYCRKASDSQVNLQTNIQWL